MKIWEYTVSGTGRFPVDMLRYDCAWPADPAAVERISWSLDEQRRRASFDKTAQPIRLASMMHSPTVDRWRSFMWFVSDVEERKI